MSDGTLPLDSITAWLGRFAELVTDLGGHDLSALLQAYRQCDEVTDRPSVVFAYTVKGWGLPIAGNPRNHSALLSGEQVASLRESFGLTVQVNDPMADPADAMHEYGVRLIDVGALQPADAQPRARTRDQRHGAPDVRPCPPHAGGLPRRA